jgi:adenine-specific DNA-methyltransferase
MPTFDSKTNISNSIKAFQKGSLTQNSLNLFKTLGYNTERQLPFEETTYEWFRDEFLDDSIELKEDKALTADWNYIDLLFQLSKEELSNQVSLFDTKQVDQTRIETYLFFVIGLKGENYNRTQLAGITREVNRLFPMPVMILFGYNGMLTLSVINRRLHKTDSSKDVLEKVTVIKDINTTEPHRAHIEILFDLTFDELQRVHKFTNFVELHNSWQKTLDTKELNKRFYRELFNWYLWAIRSVNFPNDVDDDKDDMVYNSESVIRLLTRLIFVWFIKEKNLVPDSLFNVNELKTILKNFNSMSMESSVYYRAILQNLFFATLNTPMDSDITEENKDEKRQFLSEINKYPSNQYLDQTKYRYKDYFTYPNKALELFTTIPFLNGGLFECLDFKEGNKEIRYDGFSVKPKNQAFVPDKLFFADEFILDLNEEYGTKGKKYKVEGLINILSSYKFTITENTPLEEEIALDPELLGKVFENLLASYNPETQTTARKQTGSFYTPREIVNYMVDESLLAYLKQKLGETDENETRLRNLFTNPENGHEFSSEEKDTLIHAISEAKILDPACGSGAFPMGVLHRLVDLLTKLDPKNEKWYALQKQRAINETAEVFDSGDVTEREIRLNEINKAFDLSINYPDYARKLFLIENCIYGVDIQQIAIQISKLRFFISLMVDQKVDDNKPNRNILSMPNLETRFVAANTLIGLDKPQQMTLIAGDVERLEKELNAIRHQIFFTRKYRAKKELKKKEEAKRKELEKALEESGYTKNTAAQMAGWNPFDPINSAPFFDAETMFGFKNDFDVVLGNPPYISALELKKLISAEDYYFIKSNYESAKGTVDVYIYFFEKGLKLLKTNGILSYISPNRYLSASYGEALRKFIFNNAKIHSIVDYSDTRVFESVSTYPILSFLINKKQENYKILIGKFNNEINSLVYSKISSDKLNFTDKYIWGFLLNKKITITEQVFASSIPIFNACKINATSTASEADNYHSLINEEKGYKLVNTGTIDRYVNNWGRDYLTDKSVRYKTPYLPENSKKISKNRHKLYSSQKIIFAKIALRTEAFFDEMGEFASINTNCFHTFSNNFEPKYILTWVNSNLFQFIFECFFEGLKMQGGYLLYSAPNLSCMVIKQIDKKAQQPFVRICDFVVESIRNNKNSSFFERLIDAMVYELYLPEQIKAAGCEVLKYLDNLPELKAEWSDEQKLKTIEKVYKELSAQEHRVRKAMFKMKSIEEVRIIEGKAN